MLEHYYCITTKMFTSWDNLNLDKYSWYARELDVKSARKNLDRLPVGKIWFFYLFLHVSKSQ